ncbi:MAG: CaiB/BaiF CoA-transferase family protein [Dehalococcoidia bacterium]|nr:CaiB/BaiF CoA-transferase family protein [Dehalococcoidia bacterium]
MTTALEGVTVVDLSLFLPGPFCTLLLADLGAEVIKVEDPERGDHFRNMPPLVNGIGVRYLALNRNKKSVALNLKSEKGKEAFYRLIAKADVMVEGFRPGVAKRLGIDYHTLKDLNPRLIYCSVSGFGQDGPYRDVVGHDINYIGYGGILGLIGEEGGPPVIPGVRIADSAAGMFAAIAILAALMARNHTGQGQQVDVCMLDAVVSLLSTDAAAYLAGGQEPRRGEAPLTGAMSYYNVYETKDNQYITLGAIEAHFWRNLCQKLDREDLVPYQGATGEKGKEVHSFLKETFLTKTREEWLKFFQDADVCCGPVNTLGEVFRDPQVLHRQMVVQTDHPQVGKISQIGIPMKLSQTPGGIRMPAPLLGEHTEEILRGLNYPQGEIEELRQKKAIA